MNDTAHGVLWRRLKYALTPQQDMYKSIRGHVKGASVLEVGFGTGAGVLQYAMAAKRVDAIEIDPGAVHFAQEMFPISNVRWIGADITSKSWWSARKRREWNTMGGYDFAIMIETLEHIEQWEEVLENIKILLRKGGRLIMTARNANADLRRQKDLHEREWTATELYDNLCDFFPSVSLFDYTLQNLQEEDTHLTPLVAVAKK